MLCAEITFFALFNHIEAIQKVGSEYWLAPYKQSTSLAAEAEIEYRLQTITALLEVCAPKLWRSETDKGPLLVTRLAIAACPPNFAVPRRPKDLTRPRAIALAAMELASELTLARNDFVNANSAKIQPAWGTRWHRKAG
jgi:hypothetical protein